MPSKVVKEYTLQIGPPIGLDGDNGDDFVHVFWMYNDSSQDMSDLRLEEISDDLNAVTYSFDGINYGDTLIKEHLGAYSSAPIYVKIDIPSGVNEGRYSAKMRLVFYDVIEWVFNLYYNVIASRTYLSQNKSFNIGSMPIVVTSVSDALELQDNIVETASGNVRAGDRYRKQNRRLEFVIADKQPSQEKTAIEEILPDGNIIELKKGSANIYVVDNTNGIIYELYPQAHKSSINPNAPKFRRASVAYKSDGMQVRYHEPRIETVSGRTGVLVEEGTSNLLSAANSHGFTSPINVTVTNGTTYTVSMTGTGSITLSGASTGTVTASSPVTFTANGTTLTLTPNGDTGRVQVEAKPYKTTWQIGGTARSPEKLTVPTTVVDINQGTAEIWAYLQSFHNSSTFTFLDGRTSNNGIVLTLRTTPSGLNFFVGTGGYTQSWASVTVPGWAYLAVRWNNGTWAAFYNGSKVFEGTYTPNQPLAGLSIGKNGIYDTNFANTLIGPLRISRRARTDQEIAAAYAAGILTEDADTTYLLSFRNDSILTNYPLLYNHFSVKPLANNPIDPITDVAHDGTNLWVLVGSRLYKTDEDGYEITSFNNATFTQLVAITDYNSQFLLGNTLNGVIYSINKATGAVVTFINASATGRQYDCLSFDGKYLWWRDKTANELVQFMPSAPYRVVNRIPAINGSFAAYRSGYFVVKDGKTYKVYRGSMARQYLMDFEDEIRSNRGVVTITDDRGVKIRGLVQDYQVSHLRNLDSVAYKVSMNVRQLG